MFVLLGSVYDYIQEVDGGYMCVICSKIIKFRSDAYRHIRMKHTESNEEVDCQICGKTQKHHWALGDHMRKTILETLAWTPYCPWTDACPPWTYVCPT